MIPNKVVKPEGETVESLKTESIRTMMAEALKGTSFRDHVDPIKPRLILSVEGVEKSGKTHWAFTAPGPICYMSIDTGDEGVVQKFGGKVIMPADYNFRIPTTVDRDNPTAVINLVKAEWEKFTRDYRAALKCARTIIWDTASEVWEMMRLARLGKLTQIMPIHYASVNSEFREMIRLAYDHDANLILVHKSRDEWNAGGQKTGNKERKGMGEVGFLVQATLRTRFVPAKKAGDPSARYLDIIESRHNPEMMGVTLESADFQGVASLLMPEQDPVVWE